VVFHSALIGNELNNIHVDWKPISTAPYTGDLELAVIDRDGPHAVAFPCRRVVGGWIAAETNKWIKAGIWVSRVSPTPLLMVVARDDKVTIADLALGGHSGVGFYLDPHFVRQATKS